mmetsp:Transcript_33582/g.106124  ORF Transcript_33582/g.106124 Transcript_33582/m.106124 type:complete len:236 (+) Transcript_33582:1119-1826(+)
MRSTSSSTSTRRPSSSVARPRCVVFSSAFLASAAVATMIGVSSSARLTSWKSPRPTRSAATSGASSGSTRSTLSASAAICTASSRVGASTMACGRASKKSTALNAGSRNARVFPLPVSACSSPLRPRSSSGSAAAWMPDGCSMPMPSRPSTRLSGTPRPAKPASCAPWLGAYGSAAPWAIMRGARRMRSGAAGATRPSSSTSGRMPGMLDVPRADGRREKLQRFGFVVRGAWGFG